MVSLHAVWRGESMALEAEQIIGSAERDPGAGINDRVLLLLGIDLELRLDTEENGVVHDAEDGQKLGIFPNCYVYRLYVLRRHVNLLNMVLIADEVLVLQSGCVVGAPLDIPAEQTAFEVVDACDIILVVKSERVPHKDQVNLFIAFHLDGVDAIDARNERSWIFL